MPQPPDVAIERLFRTICGAANARDLFQLYSIHRDQLLKWKLIIRDEAGNFPPHVVQHEFARGATVCSVFGNSPVFMLDQQIYRNMLAGPTYVRSTAQFLLIPRRLVIFILTYLDEIPVTLILT